MKRRTLVLKKETLTELTSAELGGVAGGQAATPNCPTNTCVTFTTCAISRLMDPCLTEDVCN